MRTFITFGQDHRHEIGEHIFDKDCVAVIEAENPVEGRQKAFDLFGDKFCFEYSEAHWKESSMTFFPRGYIHVNQKQ